MCEYLRVKIIVEIIVFFFLIIIVTIRVNYIVGEIMICTNNRLCKIIIRVKV